MSLFETVIGDIEGLYPEGLGVEPVQGSSWTLLRKNGYNGLSLLQDGTDMVVVCVQGKTMEPILTGPDQAGERQLVWDQMSVGPVMDDDVFPVMIPGSVLHFAITAPEYARLRTTYLTLFRLALDMHEVNLNGAEGKDTFKDALNTLP